MKRHFSGETHAFAAVTTPGCEGVARSEIEALSGATVTGQEKGLIEFRGPIELVYTAHPQVHTVNRILLRITTFTARSYPELFNKLSRNVKWEVYTGFSRTLSFTAASRKSRLHHTRKIEETAFAACARYLGNRGISVIEDKDAVHSFHIRFFEDVCSLSIDASGDLLYKRGYRFATGKAPLRETVAASLLYAVGFQRYPVIADPCCGTGAIILEALRLVSNDQAAFNKRKYAFMEWPLFSSRKWRHLLQSRSEKIRTGKIPRLIATDIDPVAIGNFQTNGTNLPGFNSISIRCADCIDFNRNNEYGSTGLVISNLPFGKRVSVSGKSLTAFYEKFGYSLLKFCRGWDFGFLVADKTFEKYFPVSCRPVLSLQLGGMTLRFMCGSIPGKIRSGR